MNATQFKIAMGLTIAAGAAVGAATTVALDGPHRTDLKQYDDRLKKLSPADELAARRLGTLNPPEDIRSITPLVGGAALSLGTSALVIGGVVNFFTAGANVLGAHAGYASLKIPQLMMAGGAALAVGSMATMGVIELMRQHDAA